MIMCNIIDLNINSLSQIFKSFVSFNDVDDFE